MLNEKKLTQAELDTREKIIMKMKKNKRSLVDKYGKDAEAVMYGRATNIAKKQSESMKDNRLSELIKDALTNPKAADLNKDGKISDYEETRGKAIEKNLKETRDDYAQMMASTLIDAIGTSSTLENLVAAMSTDDARLYLGAIMRDYDIDNPMDINLDNLEEEKGEKIVPSQPSDERVIDIIKKMAPKTKTKFLKKLAKLKDIKETIKQMRSINEKSYPFDKCLDDNEGKYGKKGAARICGSIRAAFGEGLEEATSPSDSLKGIEGALKNVASKVNKSISTKKLSDLSKMGTADMNLWHVAKLIDAGILDDNDKLKALKALDPNRKLDEGLEESHSDAENKQLKKISKALDKASKMHKDQSNKIKSIVSEDGVLEGLPRGYFKKKFGIGKKKKVDEDNDQSSFDFANPTAGPTLNPIPRKVGKSTGKSYVNRASGFAANPKEGKLNEASGPATIEDTQKAARKVVAAIKLEEPKSKIEVSKGLEEGSFDIDLNDQAYDGGSYTVDSDGDITLVSIRKPGFVGNLNDAPSTIQSTMNDILTNSPSKSRPAYNPEANE